jgi:hypothetical protein
VLKLPKEAWEVESTIWVLFQVSKNEAGTVGERRMGRRSDIKPEIVINCLRGGGGVVGQDEGGVLTVDIWGFNGWFPCWSLYLRVRLCLQPRRVN